jgi:hypothetical protein
VISSRNVPVIFGCVGMWEGYLSQRETGRGGVESLSLILSPQAERGEQE